MSAFTPSRNGTSVDRKNLPIVSIVAAVFLVNVAGIIVVITPASHQGAETTVLSLIVTLVPTLIAAAYSERTSRDIRNGVVQEKAKEGAKKALAETGLAPTEPPATGMGHGADKPD